MANLKSLKWALRQKVTDIPSTFKQPLTDAEYDAGFAALKSGSGEEYSDFIIPQLALLLDRFSGPGVQASVLEIGPGPQSVLSELSSSLRKKIKRYAAYEPNERFAATLEESLRASSEAESLLPGLERSAIIHRASFDLESAATAGMGATTDEDGEQFDIILACHSMYGIKQKNEWIKRALGMLTKRVDSMVVVFHRDGSLRLDGLTCHRTACYPTGRVTVTDDDLTLDRLAPFIAGFSVRGMETDSIKVDWRQVCRTLGHRQPSEPNKLSFSSPGIMVAFTQNATTLPELIAQVPAAVSSERVKNREARLHNPASIIRPRNVPEVQQTVRWAIDHKASLTVVGGGHSGQCIWPNVVAVDMSAFRQIHVLDSAQEGRTSELQSNASVVVEAGCTSGEIIQETMKAGLTVPLGSRPSVGAGLWLQGGIGHLARSHGLACDAIIGAVMVSVSSGQVLYVGEVPSPRRPPDAVRPERDAELLWAIKGAGTNVGIVISAVFKAYAALNHTVWNWAIPLKDHQEAQTTLSNIDCLIAKRLPPHCSVDAYLYGNTDSLCVGIAVFQSWTGESGSVRPTSPPRSVCAVLGPEEHAQSVDGVGLFETDMYMFRMHGGHGGSKTSSFKRCLFLKDVSAAAITDILVAAVECRPSQRCYLHMLQGGGAIRDVNEDDTAFGCRDWDFACVVTGVWLRDQDGTVVAQAAVQWVYEVAAKLLPFSTGSYGADLGPDPRDAALASKAFGSNARRVARLKHEWDPNDILSYACPLLGVPTKQQLIVLVTGESCAGKDYCADVWVSCFTKMGRHGLKARAMSISNAIKRQYAVACGAEFERLLHDRPYKEQHRPALSMYFQDQVRQRPRLPEEQFESLLSDALDVNVLLITGMRDEAPVAAFSHLASGSRVIEVRIETNITTLRARGKVESDAVADDSETTNARASQVGRPDFVFRNDSEGHEAAKNFCERNLFPFFDDDLMRLAEMVRTVPDFPHPGVRFKDVLGISQQPGGLALCASLLQTHFTGDWGDIQAVACCEAGAFVFASALAAKVGVPLALIREAGKRPPPTFSVSKSPSYISSTAEGRSGEKMIEISRDALRGAASVVVVDDVLATGSTLCAVLQLLFEAGIGDETVSVLVLAEFPSHRGRDLLRRHGFVRCRIQSLLVFGGS